VKRLLDGNVGELREKYLFHLAHLCHIPPPMVGALRYLDFIRLILSIDSYHESQAKGNN